MYSKKTHQKAKATKKEKEQAKRARKKNCIQNMRKKQKKK